MSKTEKAERVLEKEYEKTRCDENALISFFWQIVAYDIFLHMFAFSSSGFFRLLEYGNL